MKKFAITLFFLLISLFGFSTTPTGDVDQYFCTASNPTIADFVVVGDNIVWYATNDSTSTPLLETQVLVDETTYYAFDSLDTNAGSLAVTVHLIYYPAPIGDTEQFFCENENVSLGDLIVFNTDDFDGIYWYSTETQENGTELPISTTLEDGVTYYAFQAVCGCGNNDCLGVLPVTVNLIESIPAPTGNSPIDMCEAANSTLADLPVFNTAGFDGIYWYSTETQENGTELPISTTLEDGVTYYAFQAVCSCGNNNCLGVLPVTVNLIEDVPAPTGQTEQFFCEDSNPTLEDLLIFNTDDYTSIYWATNVYCQGGQLLSPTTPLEDGETYYAYQTFDNGCCPDYIAVTVNLIDGIPAPTGIDVQGFCANEEPTLGSLIVENTDGYDSIYWYANPYISGDPLDLSTSVWDGDVYFAFQTDSNEGTCINYLAVTVEFMTCLGIDDNQIGSFNLSPNPVKDILNLDFKNTNDKVSIKIYNTYGSLVYKNDFFNKEHVAVDVSELNSGIYFISSKIDKATNTIKFIKD